MYIERKDVPAVILNAFSNYKGKTFEVKVAEKVSLNNSYWSGGTKSDYVAVNLATGVKQEASGISSPYRLNGEIPEVDIPVGVAIVEHVIFCGKDMGLRIYIRPENATPLLGTGEKVDLTDDQKVVLRLTRSLKSSYGGISNYRQHSSGFSLDKWNTIKQGLIELGYLAKNGALTTKGRNIAKGL